MAAAPLSGDSDSGSGAQLSASFRAPTAIPQSLQHQLQKRAELRLEEAQQYIHYLRAQREYITLLERYNPGVNFSEEER
ncbi:hypothetical protein LTR53_017228, partial [Teratosphaeriaceae sp. CCFEE 6253]